MAAGLPAPRRHAPPPKSAKDVPARWYIKVERDPERAARLEQQQNAAIIKLLRWAALHHSGNVPPSRPAATRTFPLLPPSRSRRRDTADIIAYR